MSKKPMISARGVVAPFAAIHRPDTKYNDRGIYKVVLTIPQSDPKCQEMIDAIIAAHEANYKQVVEEFEKNPPKAKPGKKPLKPYEGEMPFVDNEDGTVSFTFKSYGSYKDKKTDEIKNRVIPVVDGKGKRLADVPIICGGSECKVKYTLVPYGFTAVAGASVKLQLEGVMLLKLVEFGGSTDSDWADEVEEDAEDFSGRTFSRDNDYDEDDEGGSSEDSDEDDGDGDY